ncbi:MAG: hypothetical protein CBB96_05690 [Gammaproteobacteria bacterium TMED36]|nr:MAG: hypothetical protein CBB96_05690 [Gammaproteobacteria bacterium TMED36]|tara:strand:+ start:672 stop:923 length:252 start_codon:yes stop_codon:yes gene_type:complete
MIAIHKSLDTIDNIHDKTFYGLRTDSTSNLSVDVMKSNDSSPIVLPDSAYAKDPDGYRQYFWAKDAITFRMNTNTGHLEMVIL